MPSNEKDHWNPLQVYSISVTNFSVRRIFSRYTTAFGANSFKMAQHDFSLFLCE